MIIDLKNASIFIRDGSGSEVEVVLGEGNVTFSEKRPLAYTKNKGLLYDVRRADEEAVDVSFDCMWEYLQGNGSIPSIREALTKTGDAAAWTSTSSDECEPYSVNILILHSPTCSGTLVEAEYLELKDFRVEDSSFDLRQGTIRFTGKCNRVQSSVGRFLKSFVLEEHIGPTTPSFAGTYTLSGFNEVAGVKYGIWQKTILEPRIARVIFKQGQDSQYRYYIQYITSFLSPGVPDPEATTDEYSLDNPFGTEYQPFGDYTTEDDPENPDVRIDPMETQA
jgi:hypothetical protein